MEPHFSRRQPIQSQKPTKHFAIDYGLHYAKNSMTAHFVDYWNNDLISDINTINSTSGIMFDLGKYLAN